MLPLSIVLAGLMALAAGSSSIARPGHKAAATGPVFSLEATVPRSFGDWHEIQQQSAQVVNPQTQQLLDKLYSQILTRTYVDSSGYRIMVSLAYGDDQRGGLAAHKPEVCYPAQGFAVTGTGESTIDTQFGRIAARRLNTSLGARKEPVTYWFNVGDRQVRNQIEQRMIEMRLGLLGQIPDGLLFRISSIDDNPQHAYAAQDAFVKSLLGSVGPVERLRLAGLEGQPKPL